MTDQTAIADSLDRPETEAFVGEAEAPPIEKVDEKPLPPRGEGGRFTKAEKAEDKPLEKKPEDKPKAEEKPLEKPEPKVIPLASHLEERNKLKAEKEAADARAKALEAELAALRNPPKPPPPTPDYTQDPKAYVDHQVQEGVNKALAELKGVQAKVEETGKTAEQIQAESRYNQFVTHLGNVEQQFVAQNGDYYEALNHVRTVRAQQFSELYPQATAEQIRTAIAQEELQLAAQIMQAGRNPCEVAYRYAKTMGYSGKPAAQQNGKAGEALPPPPPGPKVLDPSQTLGASGESGGNDLSSDDDGDILSQAIRERFARKKAS